MESTTAVPGQEQTQESQEPKPTEKVLARVDALELKRAAMNLKKIAPRKTTLPVLKLAKVDTRGGELTLSATDLDTTLVLTLDGADVEGSGVASCNPCELKKVLTSTNAETVELRVSSDSPGLILRAGDVRFTFMGLPEDEFPSLPDVDGQEDRGAVDLDAETWGDLGDRMTPFVSTEEGRPILQGVFFERSNPELNVVATNGHHMIVRTESHPAGAKAFKAIIPSEALKPLRLILKRAGVDLEATGTLDVGENHARLSFPGVTILTRLVEGPYPNWRQVVPTRYDFVGATDLPRSELLETVKTVDVAASDQTHRTGWHLTPGEPVKVTADSPDGPSAEATIQGTTYWAENGEPKEPMRIGFNAKYLEKIAKAHTADTLRLRVVGPKRAAMIEPEPADGWQTLLMPMRLLD